MNRFGFGAAMVGLSLVLALPGSLSAQQAAADSAISAEPDMPVRPAAGSSAPRYFIEFRSRSALSYGHTFVVFGRVGERLTRKNVAGLHPRGDSPATYVLGHVLPVPAETGASDGDLEPQYITARYRVALSARQYAALVPKIRQMQADPPPWNAVVYNCNTFAGDIAHLVGLTAPPPWMLPEDFVNALRALNEPAANAMARHTPVKRQ